MAYSLRKPLKKTTKRIIAVILAIIGVIYAVFVVKYAIWGYMDIRFKNDQNYIPQHMEAKLWNLIDFPDSELLPVEKIQALFPLSEDESERTAIADELIQLFMERVNPEYEIEKYFDPNDRFWITTSKRMEYGGAKGMFSYSCNYDPYNPNEGSVRFYWLANGVYISYTYRTNGSAYKQHMTTVCGLSNNYSYTRNKLRYATYGVSTSEYERSARLVLSKSTGSINLRKGFNPVLAELSTEDLAAYRNAQANGEAPKRTSIREIQKYIKKIKRE